LSRLETSREMGGHGGALPGHFVYAQAESLAMAVVSMESPEIALARVRFRRAAAVGETLICKAQVIRRSPGREVVLALVRAGGDEIFRGKFEVLAGREA
ncbi:fatty acid biosynthesis-containing protein transcriptional regulator, partial [mine drainage metagenome]